MNLQKNSTFSLKVVPNAKQTLLKEEHGQLKLYIHEQPEKGKANKAVIAYFKKEHKCTIRILKGNTSREKLIQVILNTSI